MKQMSVLSFYANDAVMKENVEEAMRDPRYKLIGITSTIRSNRDATPCHHYHFIVDKK
jgi:hypothetical protein